MNATDIQSPFSREFGPKNTALPLLSSCGSGGNDPTRFSRLFFRRSEKVRHMTGLISDEDLARARQDPVFHQRFYADNLDRLLEALDMMRKNAGNSAEQTRLIKGGVDLAVKLADRLNTKSKSPPKFSGSAAA
jgi:hypothetical protein